MKSYHNSLFLFIAFFYSSVVFAGSYEFTFEHLPYTDKLPSNSITRIYHDKEGYMWFGSKDGLYRFDGYEVKVFRSNSSNPNRLTNNNIMCIAEDNLNRIWFGTTEGINILDKRNYSIRPYENPYIGRDRINSLCCDRKGNIWIGTNNNGIVRITPDGKISHYYASAQNKSKRVPGNSVTYIYLDRQGNIWAMFWHKGLVLYREKSDDFMILPLVGKNNNPFRVLQDKNNNYWIATWGDGLFSMELSRISSNPYTPVTILQNGKPAEISNVIYGMVQDPQVGYLWAVTYSGFNVLQITDKKTLKIIDSGSMFKDTYSKLFHEVAIDRHGNLWLGSVGEGIFHLNFNKPLVQTNTLSSIAKDLGFPPNVVRFCESADHKIYFVINRKGLYILNPETGVITRPATPEIRAMQSITAMQRIKRTGQIWICPATSDIYAISDKVEGSPVQKASVYHINKEITISYFFEDSKGDVWIGSNKGLFKKPVNGPIKIVNDNIENISVITEDRSGNIWIGSDKQGVFKIINSQNNRVAPQISAFNKKNGFLRSNSIQSICCRKNGEVYIGTQEGSIYRYNKKNNTMNDVSLVYGITDESVMDILEDNMGDLWISTIKKIIKFNPETHITTYFTQNDGILVRSFSKDACIKLNNGKIMFGGNRGLCIFDPKNQIRKNAVIPSVAITDIAIQNQSVYGNEDNNHLDISRNKLTLNHDEDNLGIEFSALDYSGTDKIQYAYMLSGIDKDWIYVGNNRRYVNYANLPAGKYTFMVKATDEYGSWSNKITSLNVVKRPPLYQTWWAYLIYLLLSGLIVNFLYNRFQLKHALRISRIEKEKSEELAQTKLRYFTNISHELLTPLTVISLLIDEMQQKNRNDKTQLDLVRTNVNRLKRLIKQVLAFRKVESGNMTLKVNLADVVDFVREISILNFQPLIKEKEIRFSIETEYDHFPAYFDADKLDKVLYNLISNALKFTPAEGTVKVEITFPYVNETAMMQISVSDSGIGISEKELPHIFEPFFISSQSDQSQSNGIGLSLTKDLIQIHKGDISVESKINEGSVFTFMIPVSEEAYSEDEIEITQENEDETAEFKNLPETGAEGSTEEKLQSFAGKNNLLVVEDNPELKNIIVNALSRSYNVLSAENGLEALDIITSHEIDLVISDVMMPKMDGLTLCKHLKSDVATSHINILLLTAKISSDDQIDYYNSGADAFMPKPFDLKVLEALVKNLINKRKQQTDDFQTAKEINISSMQYNSLDEEFLKKAVEIVESRLSDIDFDFDQFATEMSSSKSTLHRKLKALTDLSPVEFIRNIRLKHACRMLQQTKDPISEISYEVGFSNPKYFSNVFKANIGMTPREYRDSVDNHQVSADDDVE